MANSPVVKTKNPLGVTTDEEDDECVLVNLVIPEIKKKPFKNEAKGGVVITHFENRSFSIDLKLETSKTTVDHYKYEIRKLPDDIIPTECSHKVRDGKIIVKLKKLTHRSWVHELSDGGLETYVEEDKD